MIYHLAFIIELAAAALAGSRIKVNPSKSKLIESTAERDGTHRSNGTGGSDECDELALESACDLRRFVILANRPLEG